MNIPANRIRSYRAPKNVIGKIIQFPLVRSIIAIVFVIAPLMGLKQLVDLVIDGTSEPMTSYLRDFFAVLRLAVAVLMYRLFTRALEKRSADEMAPDDAVPETGIGILFGGTMMALLVGILWVFSCYSVESAGSFDVVLHALFFFGYAAFLEEIVFRAILFRHVEELTGSWGAIIFTGLLFGGLHIGNPNATIWTSSAIALQSLVISGCWVLTRRIWLVWGLHLGWNYFQNAIFGVAVSGANDFDSVLIPTISGPEWLTGGAFGIEGSYVSVIVVAAIGVFLILRAGKAGQLLGPLWVRKIRHAERTPSSNPILEK